MSRVLVISGVAASTAAAQEASRLSPAAPANESATGYDWTPDSDEKSVEPPEPLKPLVREGLVILPFFGVAFPGWGSMKTERECHAGLCDSRRVEHAYDQNVNALMGLNGLYYIVSGLRAGMGLQWTPAASLSSMNLGTEYASFIIVEWVVGRKHAGAVRGFAGASLLFPDRELQEVIDEHDAQCLKVADDGGLCDVEAGPYTGFAAGAAAAYLAQISDGVALRFELAIEYGKYSGPRIDVEYDSGTEYSDSRSWSGTRVVSRFGVEF